MTGPDPAALAAIAAAYALLVARSSADARPPQHRWRDAGRYAFPDASRARAASRVGSRWAAAGRLDG